HGRVDAHTTCLEFSGDRDADHAATGRAGDFELGQFFLRALEVVLHALRLLHHLGDIATHIQFSLRGRMESGTSTAPCSINLLTIGSARKASSASDCFSLRWRSMRACKVSPLAVVFSKRTCGAAPRPAASCWDSWRTSES